MTPNRGHHHTARPVAPIRTLQEVADAWHAKTGQRLSRASVWNILRAAHVKLARALESERAA